ncbi:MAG: APC family permease [Ignavibacteriaceae bacterium]|nr:APC family permease [Ignavibacteriaceae bacterium]
MNLENEKLSLANKIKQIIFGAPRNINDPRIFHKLALIPLLAWIGLGADGLSSSSYGPEEAFRAIGNHTYLALFLALGTALTVFIISYAYSRIIEHFPHGGGGYIVATHMLGERAGVISGSALIVDYILTITVSIAACSDAIFSYLPVEFQHLKLTFASLMIILLIILNIRGIKESITGLAPIFITFIVTHALLLGYGIFTHVGQIHNVVTSAHQGLSVDLKTIGFFGLFLIFIRAYSLGGGTYTGIEAVSNGLQIMRDPKVQTGKRTMVYMATSLAITAGGLLFCYLLFDVHPTAHKTLNSVLADSLFGTWTYGKAIAVITIFSEGALLLVGAQAGFIDAPRVMANMAVDSWLPHRFSVFSERLTMRNGVLMVGIAALLLLIYTRGSIMALVVMYSINVFLTFSLSEFGMSRFFIKHRKEQKEWKKHLSVHLTGLTMCITILCITVFEKFLEGGWLTLVITSALIILCYTIRSHYRKIEEEKKKFDDLLTSIPVYGQPNESPVDKTKMTAIQLVSGFNGFGVHTFLTTVRQFPDFYKNFIFASVVVVDQGVFKGEEGLDEHKKHIDEGLRKYVEFARNLGFPADYRFSAGTDVIKTATDLCVSIHKEFPHSMVFTGKLAFQEEKFYHGILHNETSFTLQRHLHFLGIPNLILPIKMD